MEANVAIDGLCESLKIGPASPARVDIDRAIRPLPGCLEGQSILVEGNKAVWVADCAEKPRLILAVAETFDLAGYQRAETRISIHPTDNWCVEKIVLGSSEKSPLRLVTQWHFRHPENGTKFMVASFIGYPDWGEVEDPANPHWRETAAEKLARSLGAWV